MVCLILKQKFSVLLLLHFSLFNSGGVFLKFYYFQYECIILVPRSLAIYLFSMRCINLNLLFFKIYSQMLNRILPYFFYSNLTCCKNSYNNKTKSNQTFVSTFLLSSITQRPDFDYPTAGFVTYQNFDQKQKTSKVENPSKRKMEVLALI